MFRVECPSGDSAWSAYLECRYRGLYEPLCLPRSCTTSELDTPRDRAEVLHRMVVPVGASERDVLEPGGIAAVGRLDLQPGHPRGASAQLRYCAVAEAWRGKGAGQVLVGHLEDEARARGLHRLWMEARVAALNFYLRLGYVDMGEGPTKWGVIPHRIMEKAL